MPLVVKDRVRENSVTSGTGTLTLTGAVLGFQTFSSAIGNTNTTYYAITESGTANWEVGLGTVGAGTLTRDTVLESSNSGSLVNFGSAAKDVFCTYPAEKSVDIETPQTLTNKTISGASNTITNVSLTAGVTGVLPEANGGTGSSAGNQMFKNRIINGAMMIDQRNAGASVTVNTGNQTFSIDRWWGQGTPSSGVYTMQRSTVAPAGFTNSLLMTVTTTDSSLASTDLYDISQFIEGFNVADLGFGTASAATITVSFWVRSSVTGTFGGALGNNAGNRGYPFTYTISSANTWEQKSVTIAGDTTGTWTTDNSIGLRLYFGLGVGSNFSASAGAWGGGLYLSAIGATNLMATSGATFYITGVQLEKGSTATSFDYRPYGQELALCQRYLPAFKAASADYGIGISGQAYSTTAALICYPFMVQPRVAPTGITVSNGTHFSVTAAASNRLTTTSVTFNNGTFIAGVITASVSSGLTAGNATTLWSSNASAQILWTGCEL